MSIKLSIFLILFSFNLFSENMILHIEGDLNKKIIEGINISLKKYNFNPVSEKLSKEIFQLKVKKYGKCTSHKCLEEISKVTRMDIIIVINILKKDDYYVIKSRFINFSTNITRKKTVYYDKKNNDFISFGKESTNYLLEKKYKKVFYLSITDKNSSKKKTIVTNDIYNGDIIKHKDIVEKKKIGNPRKNRLGVGLSLIELAFTCSYFINSSFNIELSVGVVSSIAINFHIKSKSRFTYFAGFNFALQPSLPEFFALYIPMGIWYSGKDHYFSINTGPIYIYKLGIHPWIGVKFGYLF